MTFTIWSFTPDRTSQDIEGNRHFQSTKASQQRGKQYGPYSDELACLHPINPSRVLYYPRHSSRQRRCCIYGRSRSGGPQCSHQADPGSSYSSSHDYHSWTLLVYHQCPVVPISRITDIGFSGPLVQCSFAGLFGSQRGIVCRTHGSFLIKCPLIGVLYVIEADHVITKIYQFYLVLYLC